MSRSKPQQSFRTARVITLVALLLHLPSSGFISLVAQAEDTQVQTPEAAPPDSGAVTERGADVRDYRTPRLFSRIDYLGDYPYHRGTGWSKNLQGLAHDQQNWFITQTSILWKFPITYDLNRPVITSFGGALAPGVLRVGIPDSLKQLRYDHFGDLDQRGGFLFIPLEGSDIPEVRGESGQILRPGSPPPPPRIALFRAHDLSFVASFVLTWRTQDSTWRTQVQAGWCALRQEPDGLYLYTSNTVIDNNNPLFRYRVDLRAISASPANVAGAIQFMNSVSMPVSIKPYLQGGEFSADGLHLFLINGKDKDFDAKDGGIWVFRGTPLQLVMRSTHIRNAGSFLYEFHPDSDKYEEPEGLTFWDLDGRQAPGVQGQLHAILLDNDRASGDEIYIKHYRLVR